MFQPVIWFGLFLLTLSSSLAQPVFHLDSLPSDGLLLNKGWRWHPGDNADWARSAFDDQQWDTIRPTQNITYPYSTRFKQFPMGWFRFNFVIDSSVSATSFSLQIDQVGASELYLDGRLLYRLGSVGRDYEHEVQYMPLIWERYLMPVLAPGRHVLAVRLSQHRPPWYLPTQNYYYDAVFRARLVPTQGLSSEIGGQVFRDTLINYLTIGLFLMLSAIHFLYFVYRRVRINLIFGLMTLFGAGSFVFDSVVDVVTDSGWVGWIRFSGSICTALFFIFLLATFYAFLQRRFSALYWAASATLLLSAILTAFLADTKVGSGLILLTVLSALTLLVDGLRISLSALRSRRSEAKLILTSLSIVTLILVVGLTSVILFRNSHAVSAYYSGQAVDLLFFVTIVLTLAVILARDYAQTNRNLEERLIEVQQLSSEKETILREQNQTLEKQVSERTTELQQSLIDLRQTQQQLIHREKMASLGELTAGVAHEIQNPLNFVNNFADVSTELIGELEEEHHKPERDTELETELLADLKQNLQKITAHGHRASSIVKGMLEHSRSSSVAIEPTDITSLINEYLKLAYQGVKAKDKEFSCELITNFDPTIGQVSIMAQEMGRVLLNLFNNAFYAIQQRRKQGDTAYRPTVTVSTTKTDAHIHIRVSDNGTGIPQAVQQKIFQPFFTTKPTGEGTGLGLSLSYDIVTKGHNGSLLVTSQEGAGTEFVIELPATSIVM